MKRIFVDTSGWYALTDKKDPDHKKAVSFFRQNKLPLITSDFIFCETINLVKRRLSQEIAVNLGQKMRESKITRIVEIDSKLQEEAWQIFKKYDNKGFSYTDCTSFVIMERLGIKIAFAFDDHFAQFGLVMVP